MNTWSLTGLEQCTHLAVRDWLPLFSRVRRQINRPTVYPATRKYNRTQEPRTATDSRCEEGIGFGWCGKLCTNACFFSLLLFSFLLHSSDGKGCVHILVHNAFVILRARQHTTECKKQTEGKPYLIAICKCNCLDRSCFYLKIRFFSTVIWPSRHSTRWVGIYKVRWGTLTWQKHLI